MRNRGLNRKIGVLALLAVMAATAYGDRRTAATEAFVSPFSGALQAGSAIQHAAFALTAAASHAARFGILYATVMSRFSPEVRRSLVAAVDGVREICTGARRPAVRPVAKCTAHRGTAPAPRCSRA